jgi:hypothetical protein
MRRRLPNGLWLTLITFAALTVMPGQVIAASDDGAQIKGIIEKVNSRDPAIRRKAAEELESFVWRMGVSNLEKLDPSVIDSIAALLGDPDTYMRYQAAKVLAVIGVPARRAVPALLQALKEAHSGVGKTVDGSRVAKGLGMEQVIVDALVDLEVCTPSPAVPPLSACDHLLR